MRMIIPAAAVLALSACQNDRPPAPTEEQSAQLNEMEGALNDMAQNEDGPQNEEGPEANASGPSNHSER